MLVAASIRAIVLLDTIPRARDRSRVSRSGATRSVRMALLCCAHASGCRVRAIPALDRARVRLSRRALFLERQALVLWRMLIKIVLFDPPSV